MEAPDPNATALADTTTSAAGGAAAGGDRIAAGAVAADAASTVATSTGAGFGAHTGAIVVIPGSPALVPDLSPRDQVNQVARDFLAPILEAAEAAQQPVDLVYAAGEKEYTAHTGSFAAWGAPQVTVSAGNYLPELVARFLMLSAIGRELRIRRSYRVGTDAHADASSSIVSSLDLAPIDFAGADHAHTYDARTIALAEFIDTEALTLVVLDGSIALAPRAPRQLGPWASEVTQWCEELLGQGAAAKPLHLPAAVTADWVEVCGQFAGVEPLQQWLQEADVMAPGLWAALAIYASDHPELETSLYFSDRESGVGRFFAQWIHRG